MEVIYSEQKQNLAQLEYWFKEKYTEYEQMLIRRKTLGIEDTIVDEIRNKTYKSVLQLYNEAEIVAGEIRELRSQL